MKTVTSKAALLAGMLFLSAPIAAHAASAMENDAVLDQRDNAVTTTDGTCVRTNWIGGTDPCAAPEPPAPPPPVAVAPPPKPHPVIALDQRTVTFAFDKSDLTDDAKTRLNTLAEVLKADYDIKSVDIAGYADRIGSVAYNDALSMRRANTVRDYLTAEGVANTRTTQTRWFGKSVPKTNCPKTLNDKDLIACLEKDRRVEVEVVYQMPGGAPSQHLMMMEPRPGQTMPGMEMQQPQHVLVPPASAMQPTNGVSPMVTTTTPAGEPPVMGMQPQQHMLMPPPSPSAPPPPAMAHVPSAGMPSGQ